MLWNPLEATAAGAALQGQHAQAGGEAGDLVLPVGDQAGGHDDQRRRGQATGRLFDEDVRQGLQRLAQAHVVGQDAAHVQFPQRLQPGHAVALIGPQFGVQGVRQDHRLGGIAAQAFGKAAQALAAFPLQRQAFVQLGQARGVQARQAQGTVLGEAIGGIEFTEDLQDRLEPPQGHGDPLHPALLAGQARRLDTQEHGFVVGALGQHRRFVLGGLAPYGVDQQRDQADAALAQADAQFDVELAARGGRVLHLFEVTVPAFHRCQVEGEFGMGLDLPAGFAQTGDDLLHESEPGGVVRQLEHLATVVGQRGAAPGRQAQAVVEQRLPPALFGLQLARGIVGLRGAWRRPEQAPRAIGEGQGGAMAHRGSHLADVAVVIDLGMAAEGQDGTGQVRVGDRRGRQGGLAALQPLEFDEGGGGMLAIAANRAGAAGVDPPGGLARAQADRLPIGRSGRAVALGIELTLGGRAQLHQAVERQPPAALVVALREGAFPVLPLEPFET